MVEFGSYICLKCLIMKCYSEKLNLFAILKTVDVFGRIP